MQTSVISKYFPALTEEQMSQFEKLESIYTYWNERINVISRKDIDELYIRHVLHSLGIAKVQEFLPDTDVADVGTGGGFPGIPLAIMFPHTRFLLVDSIGKKIRVVDEVVQELGLKNVETLHARIEKVDREFDFIVSRAVTNMPDFVKWVKGKVKKKAVHHLKNGILYLKGGDLSKELEIYQTAQVFELSSYFDEPFFESKKVVYLPLKYRG
ncbi:16S rRNA (guanine(527)-N(7))-methyltransferase RsmG [Robertkochia aurantiaca]|uniref:16S rRNA (guanine(527)-N(7))-methyltransferase RsmG n=1 Tax=Robertkochia aurantiaca TaxID=2873700 RepID=UPI001CCFB68D|nr:16S rRNA (guanine(527)-N(7))-methyltransferase RsmG [Robertkochia sp. 3YJGBD-33]